MSGQRRILVVGAGPAGLYFAYRWKRGHPADDVQIIEQNPPAATFGFGVVFSDRALEFLRADDPETADLAVPLLQTWRDITIAHHGECVTIDGVGFAAIGRLELLGFLEQRLATVGIAPQYNRPLRDAAELAGFDLVVAADGVNSRVRQIFTADFGTEHTELDNKFIWYGTTRRFETLTQTFVATPRGPFNAHHYRYAPGRSTFIIECAPATWQAYGFDAMSETATRATCERIFADALGGMRLDSNRSLWRNFPLISNARWHHRNIVLVGDALRTAHFSIGSGTRLALEDVMALVAALETEPGDIPAALARYQRERQPKVDRLVAASRASALWYEQFGAHMRLAPLDFAYAYINRTGRIDDGRLAAMAPGFAAHYAERRGRTHRANPMARTSRRELPAFARGNTRTMRNYRIAAIPGDGIGGEVIAAGVKVLGVAAERDGGFKLAFEHFDWGSDYYRKHGVMMPADGRDRIRGHDAIYFGAVGAPDVPDHITLWGLRLAICQRFDQYANVRPTRVLAGITSPLRHVERKELDWVIVRENSEGEYAGVGGRVHMGFPEEVATDVAMFTRAGVTRIMRFAFALARSRPRQLLTVVTKSNAQRHAMVMWDEIAAEIAREFADVTWDKMLVDAMTMRMVMKPQSIDTVVATNLHADILSDLAAALAGSIGIAPTANLNPERTFPSMFEPIHGSAFDIAGKGIANPIGTFWSGVMMLEHLGEGAAAARLMRSIERVTADKRLHTPDLGGTATTDQVTDAVCAALIGDNA